MEDVEDVHMYESLLDALDSDHPALVELQKFGFDKESCKAALASNKMDVKAATSDLLSKNITNSCTKCPYSLRVNACSHEFWQATVENFGQTPPLAISLFDKHDRPVAMTDISLYVKSDTLRLQDVSQHIEMTTEDHEWTIPRMYIRAAHEGTHIILISAMRSSTGIPRDNIQPALVLVEVTRNNHPRRLHLISPPLSHLEAGVALKPVVRIIGDKGHFWECLPGALTCELILPPIEPPVSLPLFVATHKEGVGGIGGGRGVKEKAYIFDSMASFPFTLTGQYEIILRLDLRALPYACILDPDELWLQQRIPFSLKHASPHSLVIESSVPEVNRKNLVRVSRQESNRQLYRTLTVAVVDEYNNVCTSLDGSTATPNSIEVSVQPCSANNTRTALPSIDGTLAVQTHNGRAVFADLRIRERSRGSSGMYKLAFSYKEGVKPFAIKFDYTAIGTSSTPSGLTPIDPQEVATVATTRSKGSSQRTGSSTTRPWRSNSHTPSMESKRQERSPSVVGGRSPGGRRNSWTADNNTRGGDGKDRNGRTVRNLMITAPQKRTTSKERKHSVTTPSRDCNTPMPPLSERMSHHALSTSQRTTSRTTPIPRRNSATPSSAVTSPMGEARAGRSAVGGGSGSIRQARPFNANNNVSLKGTLRARSSPSRTSTNPHYKRGGTVVYGTTTLGGVGSNAGPTAGGPTATTGGSRSNTPTLSEQMQNPLEKFSALLPKLQSSNRTASKHTINHTLGEDGQLLLLPSTHNPYIHKPYSLNYSPPADTLDKTRMDHESHNELFESEGRPTTTLAAEHVLSSAKIDAATLIQDINVVTDDGGYQHALSSSPALPSLQQVQQLPLGHQAQQQQGTTLGSQQGTATTEAHGLSPVGATQVAPPLSSPNTNNNHLTLNHTSPTSIVHHAHHTGTTPAGRQNGVGSNMRSNSMPVDITTAAAAAGLGDKSPTRAQLQQQQQTSPNSSPSVEETNNNRGLPVRHVHPTKQRSISAPPQPPNNSPTGCGVGSPSTRPLSPPPLRGRPLQRGTPIRLTDSPTTPPPPLPSNEKGSGNPNNNNSHPNNNHNKHTGTQRNSDSPQQNVTPVRSPAPGPTLAYTADHNIGTETEGNNIDHSVNNQHTTRGATIAETPSSWQKHNKQDVVDQRTKSPPTVTTPSKGAITPTKGTTLHNSILPSNPTSNNAQKSSRYRDVEVWLGGVDNTSLDSPVPMGANSPSPPRLNVNTSTTIPTTPPPSSTLTTDGPPVPPPQLSMIPHHVPKKEANNNNTNNSIQASNKNNTSNLSTSNYLNSTNNNLSVYQACGQHNNGSVANINSMCAPNTIPNVVYSQLNDKLVNTSTSASVHLTSGTPVHTTTEGHTEPQQQESSRIDHQHQRQQQTITTVVGREGVTGMVVTGTSSSSRNVIEQSTHSCTVENHQYNTSTLFSDSHVLQDQQHSILTSQPADPIHQPHSLRKTPIEASGYSSKRPLDRSVHNVTDDVVVVMLTDEEETTTTQHVTTTTVQPQLHQLQPTQQHLVHDIHLSSSSAHLDTHKWQQQHANHTPIKSESMDSNKQQGTTVQQHCDFGMPQQTVHSVTNGLVVPNNATTDHLTVNKPDDSHHHHLPHHHSHLVAMSESSHAVGGVATADPSADWIKPQEISPSQRHAATQQLQVQSPHCSLHHSPPHHSTSPTKHHPVSPSKKQNKGSPRRHQTSPPRPPYDEDELPDGDAENLYLTQTTDSILQYTSRQQQEGEEGDEKTQAATNTMSDQHTSSPVKRKTPFDNSTHSTPPPTTQQPNLRRSYEVTNSTTTTPPTATATSTPPTRKTQQQGSGVIRNSVNTTTSPFASLLEDEEEGGGGANDVSSSSSGSIHLTPVNTHKMLWDPPPPKLVLTPPSHNTHAQRQQDSITLSPPSPPQARNRTTNEYRICGGSGGSSSVMSMPSPSTIHSVSPYWSKRRSVASTTSTTMSAPPHRRPSQPRQSHPSADIHGTSKIVIPDDIDVQLTNYTSSNQQQTQQSHAAPTTTRTEPSRVQHQLQREEELGRQPSNHNNPVDNHNNVYNIRTSDDITTTTVDRNATTTTITMDQNSTITIPHLDTHPIASAATQTSGLSTGTCSTYTKSTKSNGEHGNGITDIGNVSLMGKLMHAANILAQNKPTEQELKHQIEMLKQQMDDDRAQSRKKEEENTWLQSLLGAQIANLQKQLYTMQKEKVTTETFHSQGGGIDGQTTSPTQQQQQGTDCSSATAIQHTHGEESIRRSTAHSAHHNHTQDNQSTASISSDHLSDNLRGSANTPTTTTQTNNNTVTTQQSPPRDLSGNTGSFLGTLPAQDLQDMEAQMVEYLSVVRRALQSKQPPPVLKSSLHSI